MDKDTMLKELYIEIDISIKNNNNLIKILNDYNYMGKSLYLTVFNYINKTYSEQELYNYFYKLYMAFLDNNNYSSKILSEFCKFIGGNNFEKRILDKYKLSKYIDYIYIKQDIPNDLECLKPLKIQILDNIKANLSLENIMNSINKNLFFMVFNSIDKDIIEKYYLNMIKENFHNKRIKLNKKYLLICMFGLYEPIYWNENFDKNFFDSILEKESEYQKEYFIKTNIEEMDFNSDIWTLYSIDGLKLTSFEMDFSDIKSNGLKKEYKMFIKNEYNPLKITNIIDHLAGVRIALNFLYENYNINFFKEISDIQVSMLRRYLETNTKYSPLTIKIIFQKLKYANNYLMNLKNYKQAPKKNYFEKVSFYNLTAIINNTDYIPDEVIEQLELYINELPEIYRLIYKLFAYTGCRTKEIIHLKLSDMEYYNEEFAKLKYIPYKILSAKIKNSLPIHNTVMIPIMLFNELKTYIDNTQYIRDKYSTDYIFAIEEHNKSTLPIGTNISREINYIIKNHNICDLNGNLWNFTNKQMRKTIAVQLIEEGATIKQVQQQLGHIHQDTTTKFYAEVKLLKLSELNSKFFEKKFNLKVGEENLKLYSEEERKKLYIDFCMNNREVEFGHCTKHLSEGMCGERVGDTNCANCSKLCTGVKYLDKWISLRNSEQDIINKLIEFYKENNISDYDEFIEYKRELYLLKSYQNVIDKIQGGGNK